ncbi:MAG: cysteine desulfurase-like protein [Proteobacteria bacterium]|nr:cysteine desulfurase-like protein [Pseudomonadota bacterium]
MTHTLDIAAIRARFPALALRDNDTARIYFDNPAGTQVPTEVVERTTEALLRKNANLGGYFRTTVDADALVNDAHQAVADLYGAASAAEIIFGQNMTTLTLHMSRCLGRSFNAGDEIVLSRMDHDANVAPWLLLAEDKGLTVRWMDFDPGTFEFPDDALEKVLSPRTKLVALGYASNCTGTINDVKRFCAQARAAGALSYVDAVQFAPHGLVDVQDIGCDFLVSSAYKWFGPHMGILWGREALLKQTFGYKVRPAGEDLPHKFETGTLSHEGMAGCLGAVEYLGSLGTGGDARTRIKSAWKTLEAYEQALTLHLINAIKPVKGLKIQGITSANAMHRRVPTVSFTIDGKTPESLARHFAAENIFVWSGHNYAVEPVGRLGLLDKGGVLRVGLAHYNTTEEVDQFVASLYRAIQ